MIGDERVVALVPARDGGRSVPGRNVRPLGGEPLVGWPIVVAAAIDAVDRAVVSTDGERIASIAREFGAEVPDRPPRRSVNVDTEVDFTLAEAVPEERDAAGSGGPTPTASDGAVPRGVVDGE